ncbi:RhoGEF domain-containing protein [Legionella dresdenensis]|uniref:RhoGEF domain-containing protein n=1 Tax=Legionella dresdenensis TaxID=450200 RepID=A0ABV8CBC7_9GAMM
MPKAVFNSRVVQEIIQAERNYNKNISKIACIEPANKFCLMHSMKEALNRFKNISDELLANIEKARQDDIIEDGEEWIALRAERSELLCRFFTELGEYTKLYDRYNSYPAKYYKKFDNTMLREHACQLGAVLINPVQHGPRYKLLFQATQSDRTLDQKYLQKFLGLEVSIEKNIKEAQDAASSYTVVEKVTNIVAPIAATTLLKISNMWAKTEEIPPETLTIDDFEVVNIEDDNESDSSCSV